MTIREFQKLYNTWKAEKSIMPYPKETKFPMKCAKDLETAMYHFANYMRDKEGLPVMCAIIEVKGLWNESLKRYVYDNTTRGVSDTWWTIDGRSVCIEVKWGKDTQKPKQEKFQERQEKAGGDYLIVKDWNDFYAEFKKLTDGI